MRQPREYIKTVMMGALAVGVLHHRARAVPVLLDKDMPVATTLTAMVDQEGEDLPQLVLPSQVAIPAAMVVLEQLLALTLWPRQGLAVGVVVVTWEVLPELEVVVVVEQGELKMVGV